MRDSCWLVNFKNGSKIIFSEEAFRTNRKLREPKTVESYEHWFSMENCIEKNPDIKVMK